MKIKALALAVSLSALGLYGCGGTDSTSSARTPDETLVVIDNFITKIPAANFTFSCQGREAPTDIQESETLLGRYNVFQGGDFDISLCSYSVKGGEDIDFPGVPFTGTLKTLPNQLIANPFTTVAANIHEANLALDPNSDPADAKTQAFTALGGSAALGDIGVTDVEQLFANYGAVLSADNQKIAKLAYSVQKATELLENDTSITTAAQKKNAFNAVFAATATAVVAAVKDETDVTTLQKLQINITALPSLQADGTLDTSGTTTVTTVNVPVPNPAGTGATGAGTGAGGSDNGTGN